MFQTSLYYSHFFISENLNQTYLLEKSTLQDTIFDTVLDLIVTAMVILATSIIADEFLVPILEAIARFFKMPDNLAGVTLLALGNGAPDIFTCQAGFTKGPDKASLGIGALLGAALFDFLIVFAAVTLWAKEPFRNVSRPFLRDLIFYIIGCSVVVYVAIYPKKLTWTYTLIVFAIYITYISVVLGARYIRQKYLLRNNRTLSKSPSFNEKQDDCPRDQNGDSMRSQDDDIFSQHQETGQHTVAAGENSTESYDVMNPFGYAYLTDSTSENPEQNLFTFRHECLQMVKDFLPLDIVNCQSTPSVIFSIIKALIICPVRLFLHAPHFVDETYSWHRLTVCVQTFSGCIMLSYLLLGSVIANPVSQKFTCPIIGIIALGGLFISFLTYLFTKSNSPPKFYLIYCIFNFLICFLIGSQIVDFLVDRVLDLSEKLGIKPGVMGLTMLAWGNCLGDIAANGAMARNGKPLIGVAACFSGQLMNLLLGVTFAGFYTIADTHEPTITFHSSIENFCLWSAIIFVSFFHMIVAIFVKFKHSKLWCYIFIILYFVLLIPIVVISQLKHKEWSSWLP